MHKFLLLLVFLVFVSCSDGAMKRLTPAAEEPSGSGEEVNDGNIENPETPDDAVIPPNENGGQDEVQDEEKPITDDENPENPDEEEKPVNDDSDTQVPDEENPDNDSETSVSDGDTEQENPDDVWSGCGVEFSGANCIASSCETVDDCCGADLCVATDGCGGRKVCRNAFFKENFDSYVAGKFPNEGPWTLKYAGSSKSYQMVTSERYVSAENSMHLLGSKKYNNSAIMTAVLPEVPNVINVEMKMNTQGDNVYFALCTFNGSGQWGNYDMKVEFADGKIRYQIPEWSAYEIAPSYEPNEWYKIRLKLDQVNKTVSVWVNDELKVDNQIHNFDSLPIPNICLSSDKNDKKVWFDDIFVWGE
jgi:Cobalamin biosynthesis protein CobT (nicotinate-mononucleotide:5, 6-dimethylbenzimidazole phosphoribosyltransferase)